MNSLTYKPIQIDMPVLTEILKSDNKLVSKRSMLVQDLIRLNSLIKGLENSLFYVDEIYNSYTIDFTIKLGLEYDRPESQNRRISIKDLEENHYKRK